MHIYIPLIYLFPATSAKYSLSCSFSSKHPLCFNSTSEVIFKKIFGYQHDNFWPLLSGHVSNHSFCSMYLFQKKVVPITKFNKHYEAVIERLLKSQAHSSKCFCCHCCCLQQLLSLQLEKIQALSLHSLGSQLIVDGCYY